MAEQNLKPCPFCGGRAVWEEDRDIFGDLLLTGYKIKCSRCWCSPFPNNYSGDKKKLAEIWNRRADNSAEVRHGKWRYECLECSVCKRNISEIYDADSYMAYGIEDELKYCPYCGTKMDLE